MSLTMSNMTTSTTTQTSKSSKDSLEINRSPKIPDKLGFKIGEVAKFVGVKSYVLRYWESEFESLRPKKSGNGQRVYARKDIEMALTIRKLLYEDRFSIEGARCALKKMKSMSRTSSSKTVDVEAPVSLNSRKDQILHQEMSEQEIIAHHRPAAEIVLNKEKVQKVTDNIVEKIADKITDKIDYQNELHEKIHAKHSPTQEELKKREKEITQFWVSSLDYLVEEIRQARKRLTDLN